MSHLLALIPEFAIAVSTIFDATCYRVAAMINPIKSAFIASPGLKLADFAADAPAPHAGRNANAVHNEGMIEGVSVSKLISHSDSRGSLCELLTARDGPIEPIVHVYEVTALAGSIRAWVYHRWQ